MASSDASIEIDFEWIPAAELALLWKPDDTALLEEVHEVFGKEFLEANLTEVQIRNFIHGYKNKGIEKIIDRIDHKIEYQIENDIKNLLEEEFIALPMIAQINPVCIYGQDKQGHPVLYCRPCDANFQMCGETPDLLKTYFIRTLEHLERIKQRFSQEKGYDIWRHTTVIDVKNLGIFDVKAIYTTLNELAQIANYKYPESAHKIFFVNANWKFRFIKALFDYLLDETTRQKVQVLGSSYFDVLQKEMDVTQIPANFGGEGREPFVDGGIILPRLDYPHNMI